MELAPKNIDKENKPKPSLIPWDCLIDLLCPAYAEGLIKYFRESWRKGFFVSDMFDATTRHLEAFYYRQEDYDPDAKKLGIKKLHLGGAIFSIICMYWSIKINGDKLDDRYGKPAYFERIKKAETGSKEKAECKICNGRG